jgi:predicted 3-demethylubiquinone-9 3-methyltransferase (glyoxalase superfamily)
MFILPRRCAWTDSPSCLWFDHEAEEAATFYVSIFEDSKITTV